jgi:membrane protease YdiL (CAAX protease family)
MSLKGSFLFSLVILYFIPPVLILASIIPFGRRFEVLAGMTILIVAYDWLYGIDLRELGFRRDNLKASLLLNAFASLSLVLLMFVSFKVGLIRKPTVPEWRLFFAYYIFVSSPSQEFLFRSNLFALMSRGVIKTPLARIVTSAATFSFMHVIYKDLFTIAAAFAAGLIWGWIYHRHPNFWGVAFSHAVVGAAAILVGLV